MRGIIEREEIAKVLNFGEYPVIRINMDQEPFMDTLYEGDKVRVDFGTFNDGSKYLAQGYISYNIKDGSIKVQAEPSILLDTLNYKDYMKAVEYGSSVILDDDQEVVIVMYSENKKALSIYLGKTKKGNKNCSTIMEII